MNRSSVRKVTRRTKDKRRDIPIKLNPLIAERWNPKLTLTQNYRRLGLQARLGGPRGGEEKQVETWQQQRERLAREAAAKITPADIEQTDDPAKIPIGEARIIRDDDGKVIKVVHGTMQPNASNDDDNELEVIREFKKMATEHAMRKRVKHMTPREIEFIKDLVDKHGDDYEAMKWDKKLNPMQQLAGELRKKVKHWHAFEEYQKEALAQQRADEAAEEAEIAAAAEASAEDDNDDDNDDTN